MKEISIILPIYKLDVTEGLMLIDAITSVIEFHKDVKLIIVTPERLIAKLDTVLSEIKNLGELEIKKISNTTNETDFVTQLNFGITNCDTEWFSILEIDDVYKKVWLTSMKEYINDNKDVDVFLPIVKDVNIEEKFLGYMNESIWAYGFSDKQGFIDTELLLEYQNYQTSGGLYKTQVIKDNGMFKNNIKLTFSYEFLLRLTNNGVKIMVVPKIGYQHVNMREDSLFWSYKNNDKMILSEDEVKFWIETAKKEYFFKNKREIKYMKD